jgi:adenylate cyclase
MNAAPSVRSLPRAIGRATKTAISRFGYDRLIACLLLYVLTLIRLWDPAPVEELRLKTFDAYQMLAPRQSTARPVAILDIDEDSIATLGQWPWPRTRMADIVARLQALGAIVVGFDIVFAETDRLSPNLIAASVTGLDDDLRAKLAELPSNDDIFAAALKTTQAVLGETALSRSGDGKTPGPKVGFATRGPSALPFVAQYPALLANIPVLEKSAAGRGLFTITPERDGIVRRVPMVMAVGGKLFPSLTLEILRVLARSGGLLVQTDPTGILGLVALPSFRLPTDPHGRMWIHFTRHDPQRYISAKDLLAGTVPKERVNGKIVLIGTSALGLLDSKTTPLTRSMPGVEIHAEVLESALSGSYLYEPNFAQAIEVLAALFAGLIIIALAPILGPLVLLGFGAVSAVAIAGASWWAYRQYGALFDATYPLASSFAVYSTLAFMNYFKAQVGRRRIRSAFSQYLSPDLVAELANSNERLVLGGETRRMSIMFSDVRGFTTIAESFKHDPQGLTTLMNRFLTPLTNAIIGRKGTIDKYMGDAIMAFWNAPLHDPQHELNACRAALDMLQQLNLLNAARELEDADNEKSFVPINIGVGINTGSCVVGNMGSDLRFDYSVLGDTVNFASRIEGQSKNYGVKIVLGEATAVAVNANLAILEIDLLQVKGKTEPQSVYALLGAEDIRERADFQELATLHANMLARYRQHAFDEAAELLGPCRKRGEAFALKTLYDIYDERIKTFQADPPAADWTGVFAATSK